MYKVFGNEPQLNLKDVMNFYPLYYSAFTAQDKKNEWLSNYNSYSEGHNF